MARHRVAGLELDESRLPAPVEFHVDVAASCAYAGDGLQGAPRIAVLPDDATERLDECLRCGARDHRERDGPRVLRLHPGDAGQKASDRKGLEILGDLVGAPAAYLEGDRTARVESATSGDVDRVRSLPLEDRPCGEVPRIRARYHGDQGQSVRMRRVGDDRLGGPLLHDLPQIHDRNPVREDPPGAAWMPPVEVR